MDSEDRLVPDFIPRTVQFSDGSAYELLDPLTSYRSCHDGTPKEARMVFIARRTIPPGSEDDFVAKIKVQLPADGQEPVQGPSTTTAYELKALTKFRDSNIACAPHLVAFTTTSQDTQGPLPGGYVTFTIMTKISGTALFGKYWNLTFGEREVIEKKSIQALRSIYALGIEPIDRGLRNVIWNVDTKECSIIDFELWNEVSETFADETKELQRWGLARRPAPRDWWAEWNMQGRVPLAGSTPHFLLLALSDRGLDHVSIQEYASCRVSMCVVTDRTTVWWYNIYDGDFEFFMTVKLIDDKLLCTLLSYERRYPNLADLDAQTLLRYSRGTPYRVRERCQKKKPVKEVAG